MRVLDDPQGYALISMDADDRIVGSLQLATGRFHIAQDQLSPVLLAQAADDEQAVGDSTNPALAVLARRHERALRLSEIQPEVSVSSEQGRAK
jgi:hypothetical protein